MTLKFKIGDTLKYNYDNKFGLGPWDQGRCKLGIVLKSDEYYYYVLWNHITKVCHIDHDILERDYEII